MKLDTFRREYLIGGLKREELLENPIDQFEAWLKQAIEAEIPDPTAVTVATVDAGGQPSQRIVLLKQVDQRGFVFYTNYESKKARDIEGNPLVSLHFPWHPIERQVKICGRAEKVSAAESLKYFSSRPAESQLAAWASAQSRPVSSRQLLMQQFQAMKEKFKQGQIPLPDFWGGFRVVPSSVEFWQGGANRLHDRFQYTRDGDDWRIERLAP
ncbi:pyridoxamine 5'-phosphate oxidase [Pseudomaricurvus alkylphenolicus]|jgi:pyridoxamine 5'-phosphate oxidase|uniref:pyridoxamine 5'-phosphate oxidase n=1 Tax=Pseudomaricurvus alkylphenolicus TaxID=1306991 RepID=UPI00141D7B92|nr:pyridoxamine 5'-phosphate oxidase [Pseudomaricurvus alkylphenolicus]NIB43577.1 pyridoxamine 5'-phosphate oxidase [Pseudomaricurvus alkylphenolicus]